MGRGGTDPQFLPLTPSKVMNSQLHTLPPFSLRKKRLLMSVGKDVWQNHDRVYVFSENTNIFPVFHIFLLPLANQFFDCIFGYGEV